MDNHLPNVARGKAGGRSFPSLSLTPTLPDSPKALSLEQIQNLTTSYHNLVPITFVSNLDSRETFLADQLLLPFWPLFSPWKHKRSETSLMVYSRPHSQGPMGSRLTQAHTA